MSRFFSLWFVLLLTLSAVAAGCNKAGSDGRAKPADKVYEVKGKVVAVDAKKPSVTLDHQDIPGLMKAMTMELSVEHAEVLEGIGVGDQVRGQLRKEPSGYLITRLEKQ
jgi:protein SCO1/2